MAVITGLSEGLTWRGKRNRMLFNLLHRWFNRKSISEICNTRKHTRIVL